MFQNVPVVLLCFYSGKVVLTGGKQITHITEVPKLLITILARLNFS